MGSLAAYDLATGDVLWRSGLGTRARPSAIAAGARGAYVAAGEELVAFDATDRESWRAHVSGDREGITVALAGEAAVLAHRSFGDLVSLDPIDGSELRRLPLPGTSPSFSVAGPTVVVHVHESGAITVDVTRAVALARGEVETVTVLEGEVAALDHAGGTLAPVTDLGELVWLDLGALSAARTQVGVAATSSGGSSAVSHLSDLVVLDAGGRLLVYEVVR